MANQVIDHHPHVEPPRETHGECCPEIPELRRLQYFYGQLLSSADLQGEQSYFREKLRLINRCVHGHGVLCGLEVVPAPGEVPCDPEVDRKREELERHRYAADEKADAIEQRLKDPDQRLTDDERKRLTEELRELRAKIEEYDREIDRICPPPKEEKPTARVTVNCGVALDCLGNEIVVRRQKTIDLFRYLRQNADDHDDAMRHAGRRPLWISICFCESPVEPVRPVHLDSCQPLEDCRYGKIQDSFRIVVSTEPPKRDERCDACCCTCSEACVLLARIDPFAPHRPIPAVAVHNEVRRRFGLYDWVTLSGIGWVHGGDYSSEDAAQVLGRNHDSEGLEFRFSRPVRSETLRQGVLDLTVIEGGRGRAGDIYNVPGEINYPPGEFVDRVYFRQSSDDMFHHGDMLRVRLRADFVLDACCRPVDGNHVGGRVPLLAGEGKVKHPEPHLDSCRESPDTDGIWRTGNGTGGGTFESWILIREAEAREHEPQRHHRGERS
jgi:hypothetical protein